MAHDIAAGLLMCRFTSGNLEYFLVHPGGPFYKRKDAGVWTIPKGVPELDEPLLETAQREFFEETGVKPHPPYHDIGTVKQKGGKLVYAWAFQGEWDPSTGIHCNNFTLEWPPRSGKIQEFPEVDRARWMEYAEALEMINPAQVPFLDRAKELYVIS